MTIPAWAIKLLPYVAVVLLVGAAVWYIDHRGYQRAEQEAIARKNERDLLQKDFELQVAEMVNTVENKMQSIVNESDRQLVEKFGKIETVNRTVIQPTLIKEIQSETRYTDPSAGISDSMRGAINAARSLSERSCPAGSNAVACVEMPAAEPAE